MTPELVITIAASLLGSSALAVFVTKYFERSKSKAETQNINISGELKVSEAWQNYAHQLQKDFNGLRDRITELELRVDNLKRENTLLWEENTHLKAELKKYQVENNIKVESTKEELKNIVDTQLEKIKK